MKIELIIADSGLWFLEVRLRIGHRVDALHCTCRTLPEARKEAASLADYLKTHLGKTVKITESGVSDFRPTGDHFPFNG